MKLVDYTTSFLNQIRFIKEPVMLVNNDEASTHLNYLLK